MAQKSMKRPSKNGAKTTAKRRRGRPTREETQERAEAYKEFDGERLIHRYANRRLYDLLARRAVTLEEIAELVRQGENVRVLDVDDGNVDITRRVLTQIILEQKQHNNLEMLPVEFLRKLIATRDSKVGTWLEGYLKTGAELLDASLREGIALSSTYQKQVGDLMRGFVPDFREAQKYAPPMPRSNVDRDRELAELRRRLDELAKQK